MVNAPQVAVATAPWRCSLPSRFDPAATFQPRGRGARASLGGDGRNHAHEQKQKHHSIENRRMPEVFEHMARHHHRRHRHREDRGEREQVRPRGFGFSNGCAEFGPKKPPPLVPSCLIDTSAATGPRLIVWVSMPVAAASRRLCLARAMEGHRHSETNEHKGDDDRQRKKHEEQRASEIDIEIAEVAIAPEAADGREHDGKADGGG